MFICSRIKQGSIHFNVDWESEEPLKQKQTEKRKEKKKSNPD